MSHVCGDKKKSKPNVLKSTKCASVYLKKENVCRIYLRKNKKKRSIVGVKNTQPFGKIQKIP